MRYVGKKNPENQTIYPADIQRKQLCVVSRVSLVYRLVCINSAFQRLFVEKVLPRNQKFSWLVNDFYAIALADNSWV